MARIEQQARAAQQEALQVVLPQGVTVDERKGSGRLPPRYWVARRGQRTVAYAFEAAGRGYSSDIRAMVGIDTGGVILGMSVLSQNETPGLGTRVSEVATRSYLWNAFGRREAPGEPWFTEQFEGLDIDERIGIEKRGEWHALAKAERDRLRADNDVSAITGATISTRAVVKALETTVFPYLRALREGAQ
jgi:electron transport complex protein RnfG